jgi:hypothetical protein
MEFAYAAITAGIVNGSREKLGEQSSPDQRTLTEAKLSVTFEYAAEMLPRTFCTDFCDVFTSPFAWLVVASRSYR